MSNHYKKPIPSWIKDIYRRFGASSIGMSYRTVYNIAYTLEKLELAEPENPHPFELSCVVTDMLMEYHTRINRSRK